MATDDKNNSFNNKFGRDPSLILDYKNFAINSQKFKNQMILKYKTVTYLAYTEEFPESRTFSLIKCLYLVVCATLTDRS